MVESAIMRNLLARDYSRRYLITRTRQELDLLDAGALDRYLASEKPNIVYLAAARVGGIYADDTYPADFIRENVAVQSNVIHAAHVRGVERLLFLGSSCIYPRLEPQPLTESSLLTGPLNRLTAPTRWPRLLASRCAGATSKPDGTPRKLMDSGRLRNLGRTARTGLKEGFGPGL